MLCIKLSGSSAVVYPCSSENSHPDTTAISSFLSERLLKSLFKKIYLVARRLYITTSIMLYGVQILGKMANGKQFYQIEREVTILNGHCDYLGSVVWGLIVDSNREVIKKACWPSLHSHNKLILVTNSIHRPSWVGTRYIPRLKGLPPAQKRPFEDLF